MKGDFTRFTFDPTKHYTSVRQQQGRVQLDADWNEQADIQAHLEETTRQDVIGPCGTPKQGGGFKITALTTTGAVDFTITHGRFYVDGILCELEQDTVYTAKENLPAAPAIARKSAGELDVVYLDVWQQHITALEDPSIREVALGGPDSATRTKTICQVKVKENAGAVNCLTARAQLPNATDATLTSAVDPTPTKPDPCVVASGSSYRGLENQLYRVEIHDGGGAGPATFKWSRDNGSVVVAVEEFDATDAKKVKVKSLGKDAVLALKKNGWVEITCDEKELTSGAGILAQITDIVTDSNQSSQLHLLTLSKDVSALKAGTHPRLRRWDQESDAIPVTPGPIKLEAGIQVSFGGTDFKVGDYWMFTARTINGDFEILNAAVPHGIQHHYCVLALIQWPSGAGAAAVHDCRPEFPALTELTSLFYVSGDGQETMPDPTSSLVPLPQPLKAGVANGQWPVAGARVKFEVLQGNGRLQGTGKMVVVPTGPDGVAGCLWELDTTNWQNNPSVKIQQVEATLLDENDLRLGLPIRFNANLSIASQVAYDPGACASLQGQNTVQKAIHQLADLVSLYPVSGDNQAVLPTETLQPIVLVAASPCGPVAGMAVQFTKTSQTTGNGTVTPVNGGVTDPSGIAKCDWALNPSATVLEVEATLQLSALHPLTPPTVVRFTARRQVQSGSEPGIHITTVGLTNNTPLANDSDVLVTNFASGVVVTCDGAVSDILKDALADRQKPICSVTLDLPFPCAPQDQQNWGTAVIGFQSLILAGQVDVNGNQIQWRPKSQTSTWLLQRLFQQLQTFKQPLRVLARFSIKGNFIWGAADVGLYLDAEVFGRPRANGTIDLDLVPPNRISGDGRRGGDFEMWFWLIAEIPAAVILAPGGVVNFANRVLPDVQAPVFDTDGVTPLISPFVAQLFVGTNPANLAAVGSPRLFRTGAAAGFWDPTQVIVAPGVADITLLARVRVWDSSNAQTFAAALASGARHGESSDLTIRVVPQGIPPLPPANLIGLQSFKVT